MRAADETVDLLAASRYTNVLIEVCDECDLCRIDTEACPPARLKLKSLLWPLLGDLIMRIRERSEQRGHTLLLSASYVGGYLPSAAELAVLDYASLHADKLWNWEDGNLVHM